MKSALRISGILYRCRWLHANDQQRNGNFGEDMQFSGEGEAFTGDGTVIATGTMSVVDFTGNYTRTILNNHSFTGNGLFEGMGSILGAVFHENGSEVTDTVSCENGTVPAGEFVCIVTDSDLLNT